MVPPALAPGFRQVPTLAPLVDPPGFYNWDFPPLLPYPPPTAAPAHAKSKSLLEPSPMVNLSFADMASPALAPGFPQGLRIWRL